MVGGGAAAVPHTASRRACHDQLEFIIRQDPHLAKLSAAVVSQEAMAIRQATRELDHKLAAAPTRGFA